MTALNKISQDVGKLISDTVRALADKKVTWAEGLGILKSLGVLAYDIFKSRTELASALKDGIDVGEQQDFVDGFTVGFDLESDAMELTVERYAEIGADLVTAIANLFLMDKKAPKAG